MKQKININKIKGNPKNPRIIKDFKFNKLIKSIKQKLKNECKQNKSFKFNIL